MKNPKIHIAQWMIFRTDIATYEKAAQLELILKEQSNIVQWTIDQEDIDNVLRVEGKNNITEEEIIQSVQIHGFLIEPL